MTETLSNIKDELEIIFKDKNREETLDFIINILDIDNEISDDDVDLILKLCDIKSITLDEIEEYFESQEMLKN